MQDGLRFVGKARELEPSGRIVLAAAAMDGGCVSKWWLGWRMRCGGIELALCGVSRIRALRVKHG